MLPTLWVSKTGLSAQDTSLATISNSLINVSITGFKRGRAEFQDLLYQVRCQPGDRSAQDSELPSGLRLGIGMRVVGTQRTFIPDGLQTTEQPPDVMISGYDSFQVLLPDGTVSRTRDGSLHPSSDEQIVTFNDFVLEPAVVVPNETQALTVDQDGTVSVTTTDSAQPQVIGSIRTADFINPAGLQAIGNNLFLEAGSSGTLQVGTLSLNGLGAVAQNTLGNSNVNVVEELVNMITTQRVYGMSPKIVSTADRMLSFIIQNP